MSEQKFGEWAILELMGHRKLAGWLTETQIAGSGFLRIDIPGKDSQTTQFYAPASVYCITPTSEDIARKVAEHLAPEPIQRWEIPTSRRIPESIEADGIGDYPEEEEVYER